MIGIICALKIEVDGLKALMENAEITKKAGLDFISGYLRRISFSWNVVSARSMLPSVHRL